jgi:hypothetical protein
MDNRPLKVLAYSLRPDEAGFFRGFSEAKGIELATTVEAPSMDSIGMAKGYACVSIITTIITPAARSSIPPPSSTRSSRGRSGARRST